MNIFYAPPSQINGTFAELTGQEAAHASKVMRLREGDNLTFVDGQGGWFQGPVRRITRKTIQVEIKEQRQIEPAQPELILGMGILKKRDRLEFAVEKAVELGGSRIALFRSDHTVKENVRMDRLESVALSAMKQSLRAWLPKIAVYHSVEKVLEQHAEAPCLVAHEKVSVGEGPPVIDLQSIDNLMLLVGPEGGFSPAEIQLAREHGARLYSLGSYRLRAETAAVTFLSQFMR